jgi:DNA-binding protein HU-beta
MARRFGEAPGQSRTRKKGRLTPAQRRKQIAAQKRTGARDVVRYLPGAIKDTVVDTAKQAFDPRPPQMREKQDKKKLATDAGLLAAGAVPIVGPAAKVGKAAQGAAKAASKASKASKAAKKTTKKATSKPAAPKAAQSDDDIFAAIVAKVAMEGAKQSGRKVPAAGSAAEAKKLATMQSRVKKDVKRLKPAAKKTTKKATKKTSKPVKKAAKKSVSKYTGKPVREVKPRTKAEREKFARQAPKRTRYKDVEGVDRPKTTRPADSEVLTPREISDKKYIQALKGRQAQRKAQPKPQPKRDKIKTDAPGEKTPVATRVTKPRYEAKGPTNQTKAGNKPLRETPDDKARVSDKRTGNTSPDADRRADAMKSLEALAKKEKRTLGAKGSQIGKAKAKRDAAVAKRKKAEKTKESQDVAAGKDNNRTGTPLEKTREDARFGRMKAAGGKRPHAKGMKDDYARSETALKGQKLDPSIEGKSRGAITSSLKKKGSATKKARKTLGKKAKEGKANESEVQSKAVLDDASPRKASEREAKKLARGPKRKDGQPTAAPGAINPPRKVKASDGKRKTEPRFPVKKSAAKKSSPAKKTAAKKTTPAKKDTAAKLPDYATGRTKDGARKKPFGPAKPPAKKAAAKKTAAKKTTAKKTTAKKTTPAVKKTAAKKAPAKKTAATKAKTDKAGVAEETGKQTASNKDRVTLADIGIKKPTSKIGKAAGKAALGGGAVAAVGAGAGGIIYGTGKGLNKKDQAAKAKASAEGPKQSSKRDDLKDKYGRSITRAEYNRREKFRKEQQGKSKAERKKARKEEMERRKKFRQTTGKKIYGSKAGKITRNADLKEGVSSRKVNAEVRKAAAKSKQAAIDARKKYKRKKG